MLAGHCGCAELVSCGGLGSAGVSSSGRVFFVQSLLLILQLRLSDVCKILSDVFYIFFPTSYHLYGLSFVRLTGAIFLFPIAPSRTSFLPVTMQWPVQFT